MTCNQLGVRISLKPVSAGSTTQPATPKLSGGSFLDLLKLVSSDDVQPSASAAPDPDAQSNENPDQSESEKADNLMSPPSQDDAAASPQPSAELGAAPLVDSVNDTLKDRQSEGAIVPSALAQLAQSGTVFKTPTVVANLSRTFTLGEKRLGSSHSARTTTQGTKTESGDPALRIAVPVAIQQPVLLPQLLFVPGTMAEKQGTQGTVTSSDLPFVDASSLPPNPPSELPGATAQPEPTTVSHLASLQLQGIPAQFPQDKGTEFVGAAGETPSAGNDSPAQDRPNAATVVSDPFTFASTTSAFLQGSPFPPTAEPASTTAKPMNIRPAGITLGMTSASWKSVDQPGATTGSAPKGSSAASHGDQAGAPLQQQHPQSDDSPTAALPAKPISNVMTIPVVQAMHGASGHAVETHAAGASDDAVTVRNSGAKDLPSEPFDGATVAGPAINTARLIQSISESEMRLGMHSTEFGDIAIRTSVSQQQVQAQISVDHSELGSAISAHVPALQSKLGEDLGLRASVEVSHAGSSLSNGQGQSSQQQHLVPAASAFVEGVIPAADADLSPLSSLTAAIDDSRLDIRA